MNDAIEMYVSVADIYLTQMNDAIEMYVSVADIYSGRLAERTKADLKVTAFQA